MNYEDYCLKVLETIYSNEFGNAMMALSLTGFAMQLVSKKYKEAEKPAEILRTTSSVCEKIVLVANLSIYGFYREHLVRDIPSPYEARMFHYFAMKAAMTLF